jgi:Ca2+/Na+ antiporter
VGKSTGGGGDGIERVDGDCSIEKPSCDMMMMMMMMMMLMMMMLLMMMMMTMMLLLLLMMMLMMLLLLMMMMLLLLLMMMIMIMIMHTCIRRIAHDVHQEMRVPRERGRVARLPKQMNIALLLPARRHMRRTITCSVRLARSSCSPLAVIAPPPVSRKLAYEAKTSAAAATTSAAQEASTAEALAHAFSKRSTMVALSPPVDHKNLA